jgi:hypothetical protein
MGIVIDFHSDVEYKVLFSLPQDKVLPIRKTCNDDFEILITGSHGSAVIQGLGRTGASGRIKKIFPTCEIVEVQRL